MRASAFVLGYHGCDEEVGEKILRGQAHLLPSKKKYDWLGGGIYFWENSPQRALHWAQFIKSRPDLFDSRIAKPFVLGAIIDLGFCLDLTDAKSLSLLKEAHGVMEKTFAAAGVPMPKNRSGSGMVDEDLALRNLDCAVVNYLHELREIQALPAFDSVRGAFWEGRPLYPQARIMEKTHIQLCVRHHKSIIGYFRPIPDVED